MDFKTDALLLRGAPYGEYDKMVTLLGAERGKFGAAMKGVRKAGAKLAFAAQPFCFAEYVLAERGGRRTVISASLHDGFFSLREDVASFYAAATVTEISDKIVYEGMECGSLLVSAVSALREMCEGDLSPALLAFFVSALRFAGYPVRADLPSPPAEKDSVFFDMESGAFSPERGVAASPVTYFAIRRALGTEAPPPGKEGEKRALRLLYAYFARKTESGLASLPEYIKML